MTASPLLRIDRLRKAFQGLVVTNEVTLDVMPGEVHALIGPNGAGKSTLVNLISGHLQPDGGSIHLSGADVGRMSAHDRVRVGLSRCFQVTSIFKYDTVLDNLRMALQAHSPRPLKPWGDRDREPELVSRAHALAHQVGLSSALERIAGALPHGAQRQLDIALSLASEPRLLVLDEPMAGMGPDESERMTLLIEALRDHMAILLIEHDMEAVFRLADRVSVLVGGRVIATGDGQAIRNDPAVQAAYLGSEETA